MRFIADFHIHSKYSRATSSEMDLENLSRSARMKGINLLGTGDFTHPGWYEELKEKLKPLGNGLFKHGDIYYILTTEVSNIFNKSGWAKKIHNMIFAPSFEVVDKIDKALERYGSLATDGRPTLTLDAATLVKIVLEISEECLIVPSHIWTPWFSLFGSNSGFDSLEECFEEEIRYISALETGLSSDPAMNWRLSILDRYTLISNSDAHSPAKIGREANVFNFDSEISYGEIMGALKNKDKEKFLFTIEFFPEEGKYHYDGHRNCNLRLSPAEARKNNNLCPLCGKKLTIGVMHRVEHLADRPSGFIPPNAIPFKNLIPLEEIIGEALGKEVGAISVENEYARLLQRAGKEFEILLDLPKEELVRYTSSRVVEGIIRVREGRVKVLPGYDGVYGEINIFGKEEREETTQMSLF